MQLFNRSSSETLSKSILLEERIILERFNTSIGVFGTLFIAVIAYFAHTPSDEKGALIMTIWFGAQLLLIFTWLTFAIFYKKLYPWSQKAWPYFSTSTSSLIGFAWGVGWILFVSQDDLYYDILFSALFLSIFGGGVYATVFHKPSLFMFIFSCLVLPTIYNFQSDLPLGTFFGLLFLAGMIAFIAFGLTLNGLLLRALEQREENVLLAKQLEKEKQQAITANQEKTRFLASASHDLRQPMQAIRMFEYVLSSQLTDEVQHNTLSKLQSSTESLASLLDSLLDISRLDAGVIELHPETIDVNELFQRLYHQNASFAQKEGIDFNFRTSTFKVTSDPQQLERIIRNLIQNAIKHMGRAGKILLVARKQGSNIRIMVFDNGKGIPLQEQRKVFDEFYQLNNPERNRSKGLGLGLSIVKRLSDLLNHKITMRSKPDKGCCFAIDVPVYQPSKTETPQNRSTMTDPSHLNGIHVLLFEDDSEVLEATTLLLNNWKCIVITACNQEEGLKAIKKQRPEFILSDYQLQNDENGMEAIIKVRDYFSSTIPAIIMTGNTQPQVLKTLAQHNLMVLNKPIKPRDLQSAILSELTKNAAEQSS